MKKTTFKDGAAFELQEYYAGRLPLTFREIYENMSLYLTEETWDEIKRQAEAAGITNPAIMERSGIIRALRKQVPLEIRARDIHVDEYYCPACGAENNCDQGKVQDDYCPKCGQRIFQKKKEEF